MIVETYFLGETKITVHDDFLPKIPEVSKMREQNLNNVALNILKNQQRQLQIK